MFKIILGAEDSEKKLAQRPKCTEVSHQPVFLPNQWNRTHPNPTPGLLLWFMACCRRNKKLLISEGCSLYNYLVISIHFSIPMSLSWRICCRLFGGVWWTFQRSDETPCRIVLQEYTRPVPKPCKLNEMTQTCFCGFCNEFLNFYFVLPYR